MFQPNQRYSNGYHLCPSLCKSKNLTMGFLELTFYDLCRNKFGEDYIFIFKNWRRFLDDCETLLQKNRINPNDLLSISNLIKHQFSLQKNIGNMPFLSWTF